MSSLVLHIIQVNAIVLIGFLLYFLLMRKSATHQFNRIYLLVLPLIALLLPQLANELLSQNSFTIFLPEVLSSSESRSGLVAGTSFPWLAVIWCIGAMARLAKLAGELLHIQRRIRSGKGASFTFFRHIHIEHSLSHELAEKVRVHEEVHARQIHALDLIYMELWSIVFWFNPAFIWIRTHLKEIHEYIADKEADRLVEGYPELLVAQAFGLTELPLANEFRNSKIKNRIMMIQQRTKTSMRVKALASVFLLLTMGLSIACTSAGTEDPTDPVYEKVDQMPAFAGCDASSLKGAELKECSMKALFGYVGASLVYPKELEKEGVEGKVLVEFVVSSKGAVKQARVVESAHADLDQAALQMIEDMPTWTPGVHKGKKVNVKMMLPVVFALVD